MASYQGPVALNLAEPELQIPIDQRVQFLYFEGPWT